MRINSMKLFWIWNSGSGGDVVLKKKLTDDAWWTKIDNNSSHWAFGSDELKRVGEAVCQWNLTKMYCDSSSQCHWLVCSVWLWYFLVKLTYFMTICLNYQHFSSGLPFFTQPPFVFPSLSCKYKNAKLARVKIRDFPTSLRLGPGTHDFGNITHKSIKFEHVFYILQKNPLKFWIKMPSLIFIMCKLKMAPTPKFSSLDICIIAINNYWLGNLFTILGNFSLFFHWEGACSVFGPSYGLGKSLKIHYQRWQNSALCHNKSWFLLKHTAIGIFLCCFGRIQKPCVSTSILGHLFYR